MPHVFLTLSVMMGFMIQTLSTGTEYQPLESKLESKKDSNDILFLTKQVKTKDKAVSLTEEEFNLFEVNINNGELTIFTYQDFKNSKLNLKWVIVQDNDSQKLIMRCAHKEDVVREGKKIHHTSLINSKKERALAAGIVEIEEGIEHSPGLFKVVLKIESGTLGIDEMSRHDQEKIKSQLESSLDKMGFNKRRKDGRMILSVHQLKGSSRPDQE